MTTAYIFSSLATAQAVQAAVDAALVYPSPGINVGGGTHVPGPFVTQTYRAAIKHPTLNSWAYVVDSTSTPALQTAAAIAKLQASAVILSSTVGLDPSWTPTPVLSQT